MKVTYSLIARFACTVVAINVLSAFAPAQTVEQRLAALESANTALNAKIAKLEKQIYDLNGANIYQDARIATLELKTQFIQVSGKTTKFVGTNVQIQKDNGVDGVANGLGNLIIGRNAERTDLYKAVRTGSHNIVMGDQNGYAGSNSFVGGYRNSVEADYSVILTGRDNIITPPDSGSVGYVFRRLHGISQRDRWIPIRDCCWI